MATITHRYLTIRRDSGHFKNVSDIDLAFNYKTIIDLDTCTQSTNNGESWETMEVIDNSTQRPRPFGAKYLQRECKENAKRMQRECKEDTNA